jgi:L-asparaginase II
MLVEMRRGGIVESRHRGHIVQVGADGSIERGVGDPDLLVTLRSSIKPFTLLPLITSGAADAFALTGPELALMAGSHSGEDLHVRTLQAIFRRSGLSQSLLACGAEGMPLDRLTASRLSRDGETAGPMRHMCSGHHAAFILLSKHSGWDPVDYWRPEHPSQVAAGAAVAAVFGVKPAAVRTVIDACGIPTYAFPLVEVARAFCLLADPSGARDASGQALAPALERVRDAMLAAPEMVGGTRERLDSALMKARAGVVVAKSGAEGLRGLALLAGALGPGSVPGGLALKIDDGDADGRASQAATVEAAAQIGLLDERALQSLARFRRPPAYDPRGDQIGEAVARFELAPLSELA